MRNTIKINSISKAIMLLYYKKSYKDFKFLKFKKVI